MSNNNYIKSILTTLVLLLAYANVSTYACAHFTLLKKENTSKTIFTNNTTNTSSTQLDFYTELEDEFEDDHEDKLTNAYTVPNYITCPATYNYTHIAQSYATSYATTSLWFPTQLPIYLRICSFRV
jgi:hypothetical protein